MNLQREHNLILWAVDNFFGTDGGNLMAEVAEVDEHGLTKMYNGKPIITKRPVENLPNLFDEMAHLNLMLCGGAVTSTMTNSPIKDLDFYFNKAELTPADIGEAVALFKQFGYETKFDSINAVTLQKKVGRSKKTIQIITKFHGDPKVIFDWFDFTVTHGAFVFEKEWTEAHLRGCRGHFVFGERFLTDVSQRRLVYSGSSTYPICALYRTQKYMAKGYTIQGSTLMHIALAIVQLKIESYAQLKEQLMGVDTMYLQQALNKFNPANPVNYGEFIDDVFKIIDGIGKTVAELEDEQQDEFNGS